MTKSDVGIVEFDQIFTCNTLGKTNRLLCKIEKNDYIFNYNNTRHDVFECIINYKFYPESHCF